MAVINVTLTLRDIPWREVEELRAALRNADWMEALSAIWINPHVNPEIDIDTQPDGYSLAKQAHLKREQGKRLVAGQVLR